MQLLHQFSLKPFGRPAPQVSQRIEKGLLASPEPMGRSH